MALDFSSQAEEAQASTQKLDFSDQAHSGKMNWAGTGPEQTVGEYFKSGFAGRIATGAAEKLGLKKPEPPPPDEGPTPTVGESLKALGRQAKEHPWETLKGFVYEGGKDPELFIPALWESTPAKLAAVSTKIGAAAAKVSPILAKAVPVATTAARGAAIGATLDFTAQALSTQPVDTQKVLNTAAVFGVFSGAAKAAGTVAGAFKGGESSIITDKPPEKPIDTNFAKTKITPEESIRDVITRKRFTDTPIDAYQIPNMVNGIPVEVGPITAEPHPESLRETGFRNYETGEIIPSGPRHNLALKDAVVPLEQGFINHKGEFKNRFEAAQIAKEHHADQLKSPIDFEGKKGATRSDTREPGLHSTDFGDDGLTPKNIGRPRLNQAGNKVIGTTIRDESGKPIKIAIDVEQAREKWNKVSKESKEKGINNPITEKTGARNFPEYLRFIVAHEESHTLASKPDWVSYGDHEALMNEMARERIAEEIDSQIKNELKDHGAIELSKDITDVHLMTPDNEVIRNTINNIIANTRLTEIFKDEIEKAVPDEGIRKRMTMALEAEKKTDVLYTDEQKRQALFGDTTEVRAKKANDDIDIGMIEAAQRMQTKLSNEKAKWKNEGERIEYQKRFERLVAAIEWLRSLPSEEHAIPIAEAVKAHIADIGERAVKAGVLDGLRNNYITHVLDFSKNKLSPEATRALLDRLFGAPKESKLVRDFAARRTYETIRELEKAVEGTGITVHRDIAKIADIYTKSMETAILHKQMIDHFTNTPDANGLPLMTKDLAFGKEHNFVSFNGLGSAPIREYMINPAIADAMGHAFRQSDPNLLLRTLGGISHITKSLNVVGSLFHAYSLGTSHAMAAPGSFLKEVFSGGAGIRQAVRDFRFDGENKTIDLALRSGLRIGTEDVQKSIIAETGLFIDSKLSDLINKAAKTDKDVHLLSQVTEPLDRLVIQKLNTFTWDYMHSGQKLHLFNNFFSKIKAKNPTMPDEAIAKEVAGFINNSFGGLDWLQVADQVQNKYLKAFAMKAAGIQGREWAQIALFAPDWTVSTLRAFTTALPKELTKPQHWELREGIKGYLNPKTQGDLARRYVLHTAIAYLTILNGINMAFTGRPIWTNKDATRVELGDGTSIQLAKHSMEAAEWLLHPDKTFGNKLGFWPKAVTIATTAVAYPSPTAPKLKDTSATGRLKAIALTASPFQVSSAVQAPTGEGMKRAALSAIGIPVYGQPDKWHQTPEQRMEKMAARREKRLEKKRKKLEKELEE